MNNAWIAALALGALAVMPKAPEHNLMKLPSFHGIAEVRASIPGRMRLYMPAVKQNPQCAENMKQQLISTGAVHAVEFNTRTASVLIRYDESQVEAAVVEGAALKLMGLDAQISAAPQSGVERGLKAIWEAANRGIYEATGGVLDARTLTGTALVITAAKQFRTSGLALPGAMTLLWWSTKLFGGGNHTP